ncbi:GNAT family N-acetyltransferase [Halobacteriovorax sp. HLS]|uniref:GNAT family N-acetyltransferase n=1 Tax=Halobacteriovorax sp. HLS TaxID=2234000 RepID=UPI000FDA5201|nr:GNAT family N-acetyltransferase [Halobacteriovorax sp. HLS]
MNYEIRELSHSEFMPLYSQYKDIVFEEDHSFVLWDLLSKKELESITSLKMEDGQRIYLALFTSENEFVGWSWGFQENPTTFYMCNSAVLEDHRRKGQYSALVERFISLLSQKGYQLVYSRHCCTNNAVIIPKLKHGFIISKMEVDDKFGVLIHLHYYFNKTRRKIMDYRSGQLKPDLEIKKIFNMDNE